MDFGDESDFRADTVHGTSWGVRGRTPVALRLRQRQSFSAASAVVEAKGAHRFCAYGGARSRLSSCCGRRPLHLVPGSLPAHGKAILREYVATTEGMLTLHLLPGYPPDLNPDEAVQRRVKRNGTARRALQAGEKLRDTIEDQLAKPRQMSGLVGSFVRHMPVAKSCLGERNSGRHAILDAPNRHREMARLLPRLTRARLRNGIPPPGRASICRAPNRCSIVIEVIGQRHCSRSTA
jgi:hypothetical protein